MRFVDYHSHTTRCGHATGTMEEFILRARELGLREFGVSDHAPWMLEQIGQRLSMDWEQLPGYVDEVRDMQEKYNCDGARSFRVRLGMEMDYIPCRLEVAREVQARYPWDYILGSVHNAGLGMMGDAYWSGILDKYRPEVICDYYFHLVGEMVRARYCDVIAHLDVPKRFDVKPRGGFIKWVEPLIPAIKAADLTVEINTSGYDYQPSEPMPGWEIIEALVAAGVPLTLSSDAHNPGHVGRYFGQVVKKLRCLGVCELASFERRERVMVPLDPVLPVS